MHHDAAEQPNDHERRMYIAWNNIGSRTIAAEPVGVSARDCPMSETHLHPSAEQITALQGMDLDGPLVMINLLRFGPDGGEPAYAAYVAAATPFLREVQATVRFLGSIHSTVIGPADETWDQALLIEYPTVAAFFEMTGHPDYPSQLRANALGDSRLYCSQDMSH